jgi:electron transfer flavoprotein alpha subunit
MTESVDVWVFSDQSARLAELIAGGRKLAEHTGGQVAALVAGPRHQAEDAFRKGAQQVFWLEHMPEGRLQEDIVPTLAAAVQTGRPFAVLISATIRGRAVAGRLAARLGVTALTDILDFSWEGPDLQARHLVFGGGAVRVDQPYIHPIIATVGMGVFESLPEQVNAAGEILPLAWVEPAWRAALVERHSRTTGSVNLNAARRVVCPGRGIAHQEDLAMIQELADLLGAEMACTRPLAEGLGWMPRERYIGISGAMIKPDLYLGIGVSGQAQHTIGMSESQVVVAINRDRSAPLVAQSDYAIAGDLYEVVPALIRALKARKGG